MRPNQFPLRRFPASGRQSWRMLLACGLCSMKSRESFLDTRTSWRSDRSYRKASCGRSGRLMDSVAQKIRVHRRGTRSTLGSRSHTGVFPPRIRRATPSNWGRISWTRSVRKGTGTHIASDQGECSSAWPQSVRRGRQSSTWPSERRRFRASTTRATIHPRSCGPMQTESLPLSEVPEPTNFR